MEINTRLWCTFATIFQYQFRDTHNQCLIDEAINHFCVTRGVNLEIKTASACVNSDRHGAFLLDRTWLAVGSPRSDRFNLEWFSSRII
jgi:hypothetical protein